MLARDRRDGLSEAAFAEVNGLCDRAMPRARRFGDLAVIYEAASRLTEYACQRESSEAEQKSQEISTWAED